MAVARGTGVNRNAEALRSVVAQWAATTPKIRRVWMYEDGAGLAVEPRPVGDSEETLAVWFAHCEQWQREIEARTGRSLQMEWRGPDRPSETRTAMAIVYDALEG